jgi:hypothetical protein
MKKQTFLLTTILSSIIVTSTSHAGWQDMLKGLMQEQAPVSAHQTQSTPATSSLSLNDQEMSQGLKDALQQGVSTAVSLLSKEGGFLNDPSVFIEMPSALNMVGDGLRRFGQGGLVDNFESTMNHAAEASVKEAIMIFGDAIKDMSIEDAKNILQGSNSAATDYFKSKSGTRLKAAMAPIVKQATDDAGVTSAYKMLMSNAGFMSSFIDTDSMDIDSYVTDKAIDGLFLKIAVEEKRIRENPIARSTDLLKKVFTTI